MIGYLTQIHAESSLPCMIVIENLQGYVDETVHEQEIDQLHQMALISAHLSEAVNYINSR